MARSNTKMAAAFAAAPLLLLLLLLLLAPAAADDGWKRGRATFYGQDGGSTIHQGSCMFGNLKAGQGTGYDIAALSDADPEYAGSCGCVFLCLVSGGGRCASSTRVCIGVVAATHHPPHNA
jgi:hypothetical protein